MRRKAFFAVVLVLVFAPAGWARADDHTDEPGRLLSFAGALLAGDDSFRSATEYLRFLHYYPADPRVTDALRGLGHAYARAGRWEEAAGAYGRAAGATSAPADRLLFGSALYRDRRYDQAAKVLLVPETGEAGAVLGTLALLRGGIRDLPTGARPELAGELLRLPRKSPPLAGTLAALLPGAGHLYTGRPRDALLAFVLNAGFLWATFESVRHEDWGLAGVLGFFEAGWYGGNVVSAVNAAHKWNAREQSRFYSRWEASAIPRFGALTAPGGGGLALNWRW